MAPFYLLFTDFGWNGPYVGQLKARILEKDPDARVVDLMHDAPSRSPGRASLFLAAVLESTPGIEAALVVAVVDPGVGSGRRALAVATHGGPRFIGPDNGLLTGCLAAWPASSVTSLPIPASAAPTFHGRDVFAPAAAAWKRTGEQPGGPVDANSLSETGATPDQVVYIDTYGNAITGRRAGHAGRNAVLEINGYRLERARTFTDVPVGTAFWYVNSSGLVEVAVHAGSAADDLRLAPGTGFRWAGSPADES